MKSAGVQTSRLNYKSVAVGEDGESYALMIGATPEANAATSGLGGEDGRKRQAEDERDGGGKKQVLQLAPCINPNQLGSNQFNPFQSRMEQRMDEMAVVQQLMDRHYQSSLVPYQDGYTYSDVGSDFEPYSD